MVLFLQLNNLQQILYTALQHRHDLGCQIQLQCCCCLVVGSRQSCDGGCCHTRLNRQRVHRDGFLARLSTAQICLSDCLCDCLGEGQSNLLCFRRTISEATKQASPVLGTNKAAASPRRQNPVPEAKMGTSVQTQ